MRQWSASAERISALVEALGPGPWRREELLAHGWSSAHVRAAEKAGRLRRVQHGVYATGTVDSWTSIKAALLTAPEGSVVSHESATVPHRMWLPGRLPDLRHLTKPGAVERTHGGVRLHGSRLSPQFITEFDGALVTTVARTAIDVARGKTLPEAMIAVDSAARLLIAETGADLRCLRSAALRERLVPLALAPLQEAFAEVWTWPGTVVLRGALSLVDPASESPSESRSRGWMYEAKLPMPETAYEVHGASGAWYVSEFAWPGKRLLGEVDGFAKYGTSQEDVARTLRAERQRQADLEDAGWRFIRWTSLERRSLVLRRLAHALA